ncbi:MAG: hypothetical protein ACE5F6_15990 [Anaerolineae bacterium]
MRDAGYEIRAVGILYHTPAPATRSSSWWLPWRRRPPPDEQGRQVCPLLFPEEMGQVCPIDHKQWPKSLP